MNFFTIQLEKAKLKLTSIFLANEQWYETLRAELNMSELVGHLQYSDLLQHHANQSSGKNLQTEVFLQDAVDNVFNINPKFKN